MTRSASDREKFIRQCHAVNKLLLSSRSNYYSTLIAENQHDLRKLFSTFSKLLHQRPETRFPQHDSVKSLVQDFIAFFGNKIKKIRDDLDRSIPDNGLEFRDVAAGCQFTTFANVSLTELKATVGSMYLKSCDLDPLPGCIMKECFANISSVIVRIVNLSMESGILPTGLKVASVKPLLKKQSLSPEEFKNFRPISNLSFLSKVIEKCVAKQLIDYLDTNDLHVIYQSAYRKLHSTETALIRVYNDIAIALDQKRSVILLLLDLSAAFDTVDHSILLSRLSHRFGIGGTALEWFRSYLSNRTQFVNVNGSTSECHVLKFGVPQGSVLGPLLYSMYTSPLSDIACKHELSFHFYADDTQLYVTFETSSLNDMELSKCKLEACVREIDTWMLLNRLKLNKDKTELLVISSLHLARPTLSHIQVCDERVLTSSKASNIGVLFDESLSMAPQVTAICKSAFYHLRKISLIRKYLTVDAAQLLVHALVTSKLDYCNSLLYGSPKYLIKQLQRVQNAAARVVTVSPKFCHITPVLKNLHWLPIDLRIEFKILTITYKALHDLAPAYIKNLLKNYYPPRELRSSKKNLLVVPAFRTTSYGRRAFSVVAPLLWNSLPRHIRDAGSLDIFKRRLKTALFIRAF